MDTVCKDCGQDYGRLEKDGICFYCVKRRTSCKYVGKEYVPLIKLKGTNEYNRAMGRRASAEAKRIAEGRSITQKPKEKKKPGRKPKLLIQEPINKVGKSRIEEIVEKDLDKYYKDKGILVENNFLPLEMVFEWFFSLCQKENYMIDLDRRRQVYDMLIVDYLHELKNAKLADRTYFADVGEKIAIVQQMRTPIDNEVDKYKVIEPIIKILQDNEELINQLVDIRVKLIEKVKAQQDPKYISNTPSLQEHDFVVKSVTGEAPVRKISKPGLKNKYRASILNVRGLYGNPTPQKFEYKLYIPSTSAEEAKQEFISYMKKNFPNLIYKTTDVIIEPWVEPGKESL